MRNPLLYLIVFFICALQTNAQHYAFRNISTDDGLPTSECYDLMQDHKGYIWVSSNAGIARYNGKTFKTFTTKDGLAENTVFKTFEDEQGRIFYIAGNARLGYIMNDSVYTTPVTDTLSTLLQHGKEFIHTISSYDTEHLLLSTQNGFYTLDKKTLSKLQRLPCPADITIFVRIINNKAFGSGYPKSIPGSHTIVICVEQKNKTIRIRFNTIYSGGNIVKTALLPDNSILISLANSILQVKSDGSYQQLQMPSMVTSLELDKNGGTWISMLNNGVYYYPKVPLQGLVDTTQRQHIMASESPSDVLIDKDGGTWMSTLYNGLYYCPNLGIINYSNVNILNSRLYGLTHIGSNMLANGLTNRIFIFKNKNSYRCIDLPTGKNISGAYGYCRMGDSIYTAGYIASCVLDTNFRFCRVLMDKEWRLKSSYNFAIDKNKQLVGVHISVIMTDGNISDWINLPARGRDIAADSNGQIYVATSKGVFLLYGKTIRATTVSVKVNRLRAGPGATMWVCTDGEGILQMRGTQVIKKYTEADGLPSGICCDIIGENGHYWIATNKGLCCLDPASVANTYVLKKENGLPSNEILKLAEMNGELYMGTPNGLCIANFRDLQSDHSAPPIYITSVLCNDKNTNGKNFPYDQNNFRFIADGLSFRNMNDMRYVYRLQGYDSTWNTGSTGDVNYNNLAPGNYTFEIKAINANGISSLFPARYSFVIAKPFWKKTWFFFVIVLALLQCMYLLVSWRVRKVKKRELKKTAYNKMLAEYHMTALRAQMNPHFIFNAINSIQHYILSNEKQYAYDYLSKFSRLIRQVLINSQQNTSTLRKELELLELYIQLEQLRFKNRFEFEIRYDEHFPVEEIELPIMLLQPFVENAIWHGIMNLPETTKGRLLILLEMQGELVKITIEDNGVGREKAAQLKNAGTHISVGMQLSQNRLEILKMLGRGEATITITDLHNDYGPSGTRIELFIK